MNDGVYAQYAANDPYQFFDLEHVEILCMQPLKTDFWFDYTEEKRAIEKANGVELRRFLEYETWRVAPDAVWEDYEKMIETWFTYVVEQKKASKGYVSKFGRAKSYGEKTIGTYGGSGHEPAQAGFVGKGMLDVQAVGDIFAAPNGQLVFDAMKLADKGRGVLLLTLNYAGDQLAGKQAMKLAQKAGLNVRQVVTGEEIQYDPNGEDNKRGLAGAVALYHIAAAAAREGKSLDEVAAIAQRYADSMASVTVKSTDATHPQNGMSFGDLGETDLMEIGAGQHGEGGGVRLPRTR